MTPLRAIRRHCLTCSGWDGGRKPLKAVRDCLNLGCPLHPYREGKNPAKNKGSGDISRKVKKTLLDTILF